MIFDSGWRLDRQKERTIRRTLRRLAGQRVLLAPHGVWIIEKALRRGEHETESALATCSMRGWVEPQHENVPMGQFKGLDAPAVADTITTAWRVTDAGWSVIYHRRMLELLVAGIGAIGLVVAIIGLLVLWPAAPAPGGSATPEAELRR